MRALVDTALSRLALLALLVDAMLLAIIELLYLPLRIGAVPLPVTVLLALVTTPWLVRSAAAFGQGGLATAAPLIVWVATVLVFGVGGPGGDVLFPADWRSLVLLSCGLFPAAVVLGRSLGRDRSALPREDGT